MNKIIPIIFILFCSCSNQKNFFTDPVPETGWDEFKKAIIYPENYRRAVINGYADVNIKIDSLGTVTNIEVDTNMPLFEESIISAVNLTKWVPAKDNGKPKNGSVHLAIHFINEANLDERFMIIDANDN